MAVEHYNRIVRILDRKIPVTLEFDIRNTFHDADLNAFNVVAEIPGTDKADEVVMLGAHFDSWHGGTGATDNAAGIRRDDGSDAHSEGHGPSTAPDGAHRACGRARSRDCSARAPM